MTDSRESENSQSSQFPQLRDKRYEPERILGKGRSGIVYLARDVNLKRPVVVKYLRAELASAEEVQRFQREARTLCSLSHPGIVNVLDFGITDKQNPYLVTDFVDGQTLYDLLLARGSLEELETAGIARQICNAMGYAHQKGVIHRDLKPQNILVSKASRSQDKELNITVFDFGLAKIENNDHATGADLTRPGQILGTAEYMSPEQASSSTCSEQSDIYSLGCIIFELLCGKAPFESGSLLEILNQQINCHPPWHLLKTKTPPVGETMQAIMARALEKAPDDRFANMEEMDAALEDLEHRHRLSLASSRARNRTVARTQEMERDLPESQITEQESQTREIAATSHYDRIPVIAMESKRVLPIVEQSTMRRKLTPAAQMIIGFMILGLIATTIFIIYSCLAR